MLIPVVCRTNIDEYKGKQWPKLMYNPKVGDSVDAQCGRRLEIVQITHKQSDVGRMGYDEYCNEYFETNGVYLEVELHHGS